MDNRIEIIDERGTGKTSRAISLCLEYDAILVCQNPDYPKMQGEKFTDKVIKAISYKEYLDNMDKYKDAKIFIDDVDYFLNVLTNKNYIGFTYAKSPQCFKYRWGKILND